MNLIERKHNKIASIMAFYTPEINYHQVDIISRQYVICLGAGQ